MVTYRRDNVHKYYPISPKDHVVWQFVIHHKEIHEKNFFSKGHIQSYMPYKVDIIHVDSIDFAWLFMNVTILNLYPFGAVREKKSRTATFVHEEPFDSWTSNLGCDHHQVVVECKESPISLLLYVSGMSSQVSIFNFVGIIKTKILIHYIDPLCISHWNCFKPFVHIRSSCAGSYKRWLLAIRKQYMLHIKIGVLLCFFPSECLFFGFFLLALAFYVSSSCLNRLPLILLGHLCFLLLLCHFFVGRGLCWNHTFPWSWLVNEPKH